MYNKGEFLNSVCVYVLMGNQVFSERLNLQPNYYNLYYTVTRFTTEKPARRIMHQGC